MTTETWDQQRERMVREFAARSKIANRAVLCWEALLMRVARQLDRGVAEDPQILAPLVTGEYYPTTVEDVKDALCMLRWRGRARVEKKPSDECRPLGTKKEQPE